MPNEPLVPSDQLLCVPLTHDRPIIRHMFWNSHLLFLCERERPTVRTTHYGCDRLRAYQLTRDLLAKRDGADIFAREFLLALTSPPVAGAHNRSTQDRPHSSLG